jgi:2-polyprenyl-3-methyl-5-hydroxy-6-metoxy-1,4-benzoquinol methylase
MAINRIRKKLRVLIAKTFPGRFPQLFSTIDNPIEIPVQRAAYELALHKYMQSDDRVLDVGCGIGYGLRIMSAKASHSTGIDLDSYAIKCANKNLSKETGSINLQTYNGKHIPFQNYDYDIVTCVDVIEHVPNYLGLLKEMVRVSRRVILISTPNRRPENTRPDGKPKNIWHLREWSFEEFDVILRQIRGVRIDWNLIDGPWEGPFSINTHVSQETLALSPALLISYP